MAPAGTVEVSPGDHACCIFAADDDQAELVATFARDAVRRRDRIFYLADRSDDSQVAGYLAHGGLDAGPMLDKGALQVMHSSQLQLDDGLDRNRQLRVWRELTAAAREDGYRGLAVAAEMSWALTRSVDLDALAAYEQTAQPLFVSGELSALCQYDGRLFDEAMLQRVDHTHRYSIELGDDGLSIEYNRLQLHLGRELEFGGEIDLANVHFLDERLAELLADGDAVADCSGLTFIDAGGCRLLRAACNGEHARGHLTLRNTPEVLERLMSVFDAVEEAG